MMILKRTGYYREMPHGEAGDPSIRCNIGKLDLNQDDFQRVLAYLQNAPAIASCTGFSQDVINPEKGFAGIPDCKTDGVWAWPGDYAYYLKEYNVSINESFLAHMRSNSWNPSFDIMSIEFDNLEFINADLEAVK